MRRILLALFVFAIAVVFWILGAPAKKAVPGQSAPAPAGAGGSGGAAGPAKGEASSANGTGAAPAIPGGVVSAPAGGGADAGPFSPAQVAALLGLERHLEANDEAVDAALRPLRAWAQRDPAACGAWIISHLSGLSRMRGLEELMGLWSTRDIPAALAWLGANVPTEGHAGSYGVVLSAWAQRDPAAAAAWLQAHPGAGAGNYGAILSPWAAADPVAAGMWARQNLQAGEYAALLPSLLLARPQGSDANELLKGLLPSVRDESLKTAVHAAPVGREMQALELAGLMADAANRQRAQESIFLRWAQTNPAAMEAYTQAHNLPRPLSAAPPMKEQAQSGEAAPLTLPTPGK